MRHRRYIAYILVTVLCLGVIAPGLLGVFPNIAKADIPTGYNLYWEDFKSRCYSLTEDSATITGLNTFFSHTSIRWDDSNYQIYLTEDNSGNFVLMACVRQNGDGFYGSGWTGPAEYQLTTGTYPSYIQVQCIIRYNHSNSTLSCQVMDSNYTTSARRSALSCTDTSVSPEKLFCSPFEWTQSGWKCYSLRGMSQGNTNGYSMPANILEGSDIPPVEQFDLLTFYMGQQLFITSSKQLLMARMDPETADYDFTVGFSKVDGLEVVTQYFDFSDTSRIQIEYPGDVVNSIVDTNPIGGIYAINISGIVSQGYDQIFDAMFVSFEDDITYGQAVNVPINFKTEVDEETENNVNTWNTFNEYKNTYNSTHVIPENLAQWLFNAEGSLMIPVSVNVPGNIWDDNHGSALVNPVWKWGGVAAEEKGFNYSLYDTIIVGTSIIDSFTTGYIGVRYFYDDTLDPMYQFVNLMHFDEIIDSYDLIIIVPDDEGSLSENGTGAPIGYCGSYSGGIVYESNYTIGNTVQGFAIITEKAIQKQMLWNFNDGITKLYQLEVDYINSEDKWKDSFLLWSSSVFYAIDSLGGKLDSLITKLGNIEGKLDTLIQNTSEEESSYWFISLWNWVVQFNPSDNDFANSLQQYDNNWNNMPSLPPPSPLPMLPGGE